MDNKEITAEWARKQAISILGERVKKEIDICLNAIKSAVEKNQMSVSVGMGIHNLTETDLNQRGFKVEKYNDQRDGSYISISW